MDKNARGGKGRVKPLANFWEQAVIFHFCTELLPGYT